MIKIVIAALVAAFGLTAPAAAQAPGSSVDAERFYGRVEYLYWWVKDSPQPVPLVTTGNLANLSTRVVLGGDDIIVGHTDSSVRLTLGYWLTPDRGWGLEVSGFHLGTAPEEQSVSSSGLPGSVALSIPFRNATTNVESTSPLSSTNAFSGAATQRLSSRLWGAEGNVVMGLSDSRPWRVELLGGFRYLNLSEAFTFDTSSPDLPPGPVTVFLTRDRFDADNDFYGGQLGLRARYESGRFMADASVKVAVGAMRQRVDVAGALVTNFFSPTVQTLPGGYFALPTNIGSHRRDVLAVVPEAGVNVGFRLTDWLSIVAGYTFLYASNVARPGNQIDRTINTTQSPPINLENPSTLSGPARPEFKFKGSDFWAHGFNAGLAFNF